MTSGANLEALFPGDLVPAECSADDGDLDAVFATTKADEARRISLALEDARWFGASARPYEYPSTLLSAPLLDAPPVVEAVRRLWIARFNPASPNWLSESGESGSDVNDESLFHWSDPVLAVAEGNYWLSTLSTPKNRVAIEHLNVGDLVLVQRSDPKSRPDLRGKDFQASDYVIGVAIALTSEEWNDCDTGRRERRVGLLPAAKFAYAIPRTTARRFKRLTGGSFTRMPQMPDGSGQPGFTLSAIPEDDLAEALAVCGISPEAMAEPDIARLAARLQATAQGNKAFWKYRWDHVFQHSIRTKHELAAEERCRRWAAAQGLTTHESHKTEKNAGFDILFSDGNGRQLQCEVKGYSASNLARVHLQESQAKRAGEAAQLMPPDWRLFAVLRIGTANPSEYVLTGQEVVELIARGGIQVRKSSKTQADGSP